VVLDADKLFDVRVWNQAGDFERARRRRLLRSPEPVRLCSLSHKVAQGIHALAHLKPGANALLVHCPTCRREVRLVDHGKGPRYPRHFTR
jgi:hypothetical protein